MLSSFRRTMKALTMAALTIGTLVAVPAIAEASTANSTNVTLASSDPWIMEAHSGLCLRPTGGGTANSLIIEQASCSSSATLTQRGWYFDTVGGYVRMRNWNSGKCMNVQGGSMVDHAKVIQYTCASGTNDQWQQVYSGSENGMDYYKFINRKSGKCLNVTGNSQSIGADLIQYTCGSPQFADVFTWYAPH